MDVWVLLDQHCLNLSPTLTRSYSQNKPSSLCLFLRVLTPSWVCQLCLRATAPRPLSLWPTAASPSCWWVCPTTPQLVVCLWSSSRAATSETWPSTGHQVRSERHTVHCTHASLLLCMSADLTLCPLCSCSDTYGRLTLLNSVGQEISRCKTSVRRGQPNPIYKETFVFQVALFQLSDVTLLISIYNRRSMKRKEMVGWVALGQNSSGEEEQLHWQDMKESRGQQVCRWHVLLEA